MACAKCRPTCPRRGKNSGQSYWQAAFGHPRSLWHPESYAAHNNARLCAFLDEFGFEYDFKSSSDLYTSGVFDSALLKVLENFDAIMAVMLPTLGAERRATYNPFMPISPTTGRVLATPVLETKQDAGTIVVKMKMERRLRCLSRAANAN